jgi:hypothetical protein
VHPRDKATLVGKLGEPGRFAQADLAAMDVAIAGSEVVRLALAATPAAMGKNFRRISSASCELRPWELYGTRHEQTD